MPDQIKNVEKQARAERAAQVAQRLENAFRESLIGTEQDVLFEQIEDGFYTGHTPNYVKVYAEGEDLHNEIRRVRVTELFKDGVKGTI